MSELVVTLDPDEVDPPYGQVRRQITRQVEAGVLRPGDRLPTVRRLAADLGLAANTVARAYRELEQRGVIETRGRAGSFVSGDRVQQEARAAAAAYVDRLRELGLPDSETVVLVRRYLDG